MEEELMVKLFKEVWDRRPHTHLKNGRILVSDAHMGHITEKVKTLTLKQRCTSHTTSNTLKEQVLDVQVNKPETDQLRSLSDNNCYLKLPTST